MIPLLLLAAAGYIGYEYIYKGGEKKSAKTLVSSVPAIPTIPTLNSPAPIKQSVSASKTAPKTDLKIVAPHLTSVPTVNVPAIGNSVPGSLTVPAATNAAVIMNTALASHGYKQTDQQLYKAFQASAGLKADGLPGPNTMNGLQAALTALGVTMAPVHIYPFSAFDGVGGPTSAEWGGMPKPNKATTPITSTGNIPVVHPNVVVASTAIPVDIDYQASGPTQSGGALS